MSVEHAGVLLFVSDGSDAPSVDFGEAGDETVLLMMVSVGACDSHGNIDAKRWLCGQLWCWCCEMMMRDDAYGAGFRIRVDYSAA